MERETKNNIWLTDLKYEKYCIIIIILHVLPPLFKIVHEKEACAVNKKKKTSGGLKGMPQFLMEETVLI